MTTSVNPTSVNPHCIECVLIVGGKYHDFDFARLELLKLLALDEHVRTRVFENFEAIDAIESAHFLVSYTCDVVPSGAAQGAIRRFIERGGRFFALHGTNSILRIKAGGPVETPDLAPDFMDTLGASFAAHPPIGAYRVDVTQPNHPLCAGLEPFEVTDELYLTRARATIDVLLHVNYGGTTPNFADSDWQQSAYPVLYLRSLGRGHVLYFTLGHCRGHHDLRPLSDWWPTVDRCSWNAPAFMQLLRRGIAWARASGNEHTGESHEART